MTDIKQMEADCEEMWESMEGLLPILTKLVSSSPRTLIASGIEAGLTEEESKILGRCIALVTCEVVKRRAKKGIQ